MKHLILTLVVAHFSTLVQASTDVCEEFKQSSMIRLYESYMELEFKQDIVWDNFSLSRNLVLLTSNDYPKCLVAFHHEDPSRSFLMSNDIGISSWWTIDITTPSYPPIEQDLIKLIKGYKEEKALVMNVDKNLFYQLNLASHEAFHHFYQTSQRVPSWHTYVDREELSKKCYHDLPEYKQEADTLILAYDLLLQGHVEASKLFLRAYNQARSTRYARLLNVLVASNAGQIGCEEAEAHMELLEGHAQFVGERIAIELGLSSSYSIASDYKYSLHFLEKGWLEPFYQFGSLQLHVIRLLDKANFIPYTQDLYLSPTHKASSLYQKINSYL